MILKHDSLSKLIFLSAFFDSQEIDRKSNYVYFGMYMKLDNVIVSIFKAHLQFDLSVA